MARLTARLEKEGKSTNNKPMLKFRTRLRRAKSNIFDPLSFINQQFIFRPSSRFDINYARKFLYRMPLGEGRLFPRRRIHPASLAKFKLNDPAVAVEARSSVFREFSFSPRNICRPVRNQIDGASVIDIELRSIIIAGVARRTIALRLSGNERRSRARISFRR